MNAPIVAGSSEKLHGDVREFRRLVDTPDVRDCRGCRLFLLGRLEATLAELQERAWADGAPGLQ